LAGAPLQGNRIWGYVQKNDEIKNTPVTIVSIVARRFRQWPGRLYKETGFGRYVQEK